MELCFTHKAKRSNCPSITHKDQQPAYGHSTNPPVDRPWISTKDCRYSYLVYYEHCLKKSPSLHCINLAYVCVRVYSFDSVHYY